MKIMIASDIHGSAKYCRDLLRAFEKENPDKLLLLGDILYHGPRNALPEEYAPQKAAEMLNAVAGKILCVRGNCDSEVDQMLLSFPIMSDYYLIATESLSVIATHGHKYNADNPLPHSPGQIFLQGHTHIPGKTQANDCIWLNPGSVSIPKENSPHSYATLTGNNFDIKTLSGETFLKYSL